MVDPFKMRVTLRRRFALRAAAALALSLVLFLGLQTLARTVLRIHCASPETRQRHHQQKTLDLQRFVFDNALSLGDVQRLERWAETNDLTFVALYYDDRLVYDSSRSLPPDALFVHDRDPLPRIAFADGHMSVHLVDLFEHRYRDFFFLVNAALAFLFFCGIMMRFLGESAACIATLERDVEALEGGELHRPIPAKGDDEVASLARRIDGLRSTLAAKEEYALAMKRAVDDLMAGISHDLRTPLAALVGYLDILEGARVGESETNRYLTKCRERALHIRSLTENLFEYFYVSAGFADSSGPLRASGSAELGRILEEHIMLLRQNGFFVADKITGECCSIRFNRNLIQRVFDNLLSNALKYADRAETATLINFIEGGHLLIELRNSVNRNPPPASGTGLGHEICLKVMRRHGGDFLTHSKDGVFIVRLLFPIH